jgi:hypothetical protein
MSDNFIEMLKVDILKRALIDGGFASKPKGDYRPDETAWAVFALKAMGCHFNLINESQSMLASSQLNDGRIILSKGYEEIFWPTALAVMAWDNSQDCIEAKSLGIDFLLKNSGKHWIKKNNSFAGHDTSVRGWPWIGNTHSWVEPTSLVLLALEANGHGDHERAREARRMLLDRQLDKGGWNYGNTAVFGQQLRAMPESTGLALNALAGKTPRKNVKKSITYLKREIDRLKTPLSYSWGFLGLSAWGELPEIHQKSLIENYKRRETYGMHRTEEICLMIFCMLSTTGFLGIL